MYDILDQVAITALVYDLAEERGPSRLLLEVRLQEPGVGRSDAALWLGDALAQLQLQLGLE